METFDRLHESVRRWIWEQKWDELRDIQSAAIPLILAGERDCLLCAPTALGKTEAAFLPICTRLRETRDELRGTDDFSGIEALYISPLKALINDQFSRLELLCERLEIPVHRWHGDVSQSKKTALRKNPSGILLMTPESLEALFARRGTEISRLFSGLRYVVIDELHAFLGSERGRQLQSLLQRLDVARAQNGDDSFVPRYGLSATVGDPNAAAAFLRPGFDPRAVAILVSKTAGQALLAQVRGYVGIPPAPALGSGALEAHDDEAGETDDFEPSGETIDAPIAEHLFKSLRDGHHLVFVNARQDVERYVDRLARLASARKLPEIFLPHHGSLSREIREGTEARLKDSERPAVAVCTSTLELGIDIGAVESVAQIGAPITVSSLRQRIGRSGRRGEPCRLRMYSRESPLDPQAPLPDRLRQETVRMSAMLELLLEGWCEPPSAGALHLSTLTQQILSVISERGGVRPLAAWRLLCTGGGPFSSVDQALFADVLRALNESKTIAQMGDGTLLLGEIGEKLVSYYHFFAAFATPEEYRLVTAGRALGTLPVESPLPEGGLILFAGRRWKIESVDDQRRIIDVTPARGGRPPSFSGIDPPPHRRVHEAMFAFYNSDDMPGYLSASARALVTEGRLAFHEWGLDERRIVACGPESTRLFLWAGEPVARTLLLELAQRGISAQSEDICLYLDRVSAKETREILESIDRDGIAEPLELAKRVPDPAEEKYDNLLSDELRRKGFAARHIRVEETEIVVREILNTPW